MIPFNSIVKNQSELVVGNELWRDLQKSLKLVDRNKWTFFSYWKETDGYHSKLLVLAYICGIRESHCASTWQLEELIYNFVVDHKLVDLNAEDLLKQLSVNSKVCPTLL
jgi:hypothetical protein